MTMLSVLPKISNLNMTEEDIKNIIVRRFIPGETQINSNFHLVNQLERQSYLDKIKDWCHYHSKEQTINSAVNRLTYAVANLVVQNIPENEWNNKNDSQINFAPKLYPFQ